MVSASARQQIPRFWRKGTRRRRSGRPKAKIKLQANAAPECLDHGGRARPSKWQWDLVRDACEKLSNQPLVRRVLFKGQHCGPRRTPDRAIAAVLLPRM